MGIRIRDLRNKEQYKVDDAYLNGYARLCGVYSTAVYNSLSRHADFNTQECFPSIEKIAYQHKISKKSAMKGIRELEKWNIIKITKEKDSKTKRQLNNIYLLIDKTQWIPKQEGQSRVSVGDSDITKAEFPIDQSRVSVGDKSRVPVGHCKDNTEEKDNTFKVSDETSQGKKKFNLLGEEILKAFESIDPKNKTYYGNKTQRASCDFLLEEYGMEKILKAIKILPQINQRKLYIKQITTPFELKENWVKLGNALKQDKDDIKNKPNYIL